MAGENHDVYDAVVLVSPLQLGGETKDQDRARWFATAQVASVCDGVTSSPYSEEAAELAVSLSPMLFADDVAERMRALSDSLVALRLEAQRRPVSTPTHVSPAMSELLRSSAVRCRQDAYQTTIVASTFALADDGVRVSIVRCGDSAFFAFSPDGVLLSASPSATPASGHESDADHPVSRTDWIEFGPGDELLVKVLGTTEELAHRLGGMAIQPQHAARWLVCLPFDRCGESRACRRRTGSFRAHRLTADDLLLVPHYLLERVGGLPSGDYARLRYSSTIRLVDANEASPSPAVDFVPGGSVTAVVPDHVRSGQWDYVQERFPADTQFVLATDGFYGSFDDPTEMWAWLTSNSHGLRDPEEREALACERHRRLHEQRGDDDLSFVWLVPRAENNEETTEPEQCSSVAPEENDAG